MKLPTLHLNGTSKMALAEGYLDAYRAVRAAIVALEAASPNARDYYPQGDGAFEEARREHAARLAALSAISADIQALYGHVDG